MNESLKRSSKKVDERARSSANRIQFNNLLKELNGIVSDTKLSYNSTLELTNAAIKLNSFYEYDADSSSSHMVDDSNNRSSSSLCTVDNFLKISNSFGIGFLESGKIVYATAQLVKYFIDVEYLVGFQLSKISFNSSQVLKTVFEEGGTEFVLALKGNYRCTSSNDICISGKRMYSSRKDVMFLGYSKIKPFAMFQNPSLAVTGCQHMVKAATFEFVKSHPFLDHVLNAKTLGTIATMYIYDRDMSILEGTLVNVMKNGFGETVLRMIRRESDGTTRYVHCLFKISLLKSSSGDARFCGLTWPFGISSDGNPFSGDDFEMIQNNPKLSAHFNSQSKLYRKAVLNREGPFADPLPKPKPLKIVAVHSVPQQIPPVEEPICSAFSKVTPDSNFLKERKNNKHS